MKVISLCQPYATLMVLGLKTNETRSFNTKFRGPLLIHASAKMPTWCKEQLSKPFFEPALKGIELPLGKIVGQVELTGTMDTQAWVKSQTGWESNQDEYERFWHELAFGDYSPNRFAWQTINPVKFDEPIPAKGSLGFWNFDLQLAQHPQYEIFK